MWFLVLLSEKLAKKDWLFLLSTLLGRQTQVYIYRSLYDTLGTCR